MIQILSILEKYTYAPDTLLPSEKLILQKLESKRDNAFLMEDVIKVVQYHILKALLIILYCVNLFNVASNSLKASPYPFGD